MIARKTAAGADPGIAARLREKCVAIAVVPDQTIGAPIVAPGDVVEHIHAVVGAGPQPAARVESEKQRLVRGEPTRGRDVRNLDAIFGERQP